MLLRNLCRGPELLVADRRGVAAMEFAVIGLFIIGLLLPISDVASYALTYMRTYQAMRNLSAYVQYNPPPDITNPATWPNLPNTMGGFVVTARSNATPPTTANTPGSTIAIYVTVLCGDPPGAACTATDAATFATPKWYPMSVNVQLNPLFLTSLTGGVSAYSDRFQ